MSSAVSLCWRLVAEVPQAAVEMSAASWDARPIEKPLHSSKNAPSFMTWSFSKLGCARASMSAKACNKTRLFVWKSASVCRYCGSSFSASLCSLWFLASSKNSSKTCFREASGDMHPVEVKRISRSFKSVTPSPLARKSVTCFSRSSCISLTRSPNASLSWLWAFRRSRSNCARRARRSNCLWANWRSLNSTSRSMASLLAPLVTCNDGLAIRERISGLKVHSWISRSSRICFSCAPKASKCARFRNTSSPRSKKVRLSAGELERRQWRDWLRGVDPREASHISSIRCLSSILSFIRCSLFPASAYSAMYRFPSLRLGDEVKALRTGGGDVVLGAEHEGTHTKLPWTQECGVPGAPEH
mmetsp:Transcript_42377/g.116881  ORF Transcript_42377/g.116881 Transcript_42377/m.116881 type:complete len:358 (+) Transcript_42377:1606-2679(+)